MPDPTASKAQAVRDYLANHQDASPSAVVQALQAEGVEVTAAYVCQIRHRQRTKAPKRATSEQSRLPAAAKRQPWTFPKNPLEEAIRIPMQIEEKNAGNPMQASLLAKAVGYRKSSDWRFLDLLRSANQYGLVAGAGANATVRMEKAGQDIVVPASPKDRQAALLAAFNTVPDFQKVADFYGDKKIPEDEFFLNTLTRQFNIPRDRAEAFAEVFISNLKYLRAFTVGQPEVRRDSPPPAEAESPSSDRRVVREPQVRAYLETCFVMMPFGSWFDKYYQDIYVPAITADSSGFGEGVAQPAEAAGHSTLR